MLDVIKRIPRMKAECVHGSCTSAIDPRNINEPKIVSQITPSAAMIWCITNERGHDPITGTSLVTVARHSDIGPYIRRYIQAEIGRAHV